MRNIIKLITVLLIIFVLSIFYISLNRNTNYDTEYLVGNKLAEINLKDFDKILQLRLIFLEIHLKLDDQFELSYSYY